MCFSLQTVLCTHTLFLCVAYFPSMMYNEPHHFHTVEYFPGVCFLWLDYMMHNLYNQLSIVEHKVCSTFLSVMAFCTSLTISKSYSLQVQWTELISGSGFLGEKVYEHIRFYSKNIL